MKRLLCIFGLLALSGGAWSESRLTSSAPVTQAELVAAVLASNPTLASLRDDLASLKGQKPKLILLENSKLSLSGSWSGKPDSSQSWGASSSLSLPILPQLSISGSYDLMKETGSLSLSLQPFAKGSDEAAWRDQVAAMELDIFQQSAKIRSSAESFYVSVIAVLTKLEIAKTRFTNAEAAYQGAVIKYEAGLSSYQDYKASFQAYQSELQGLLKAEREVIGLNKTALELSGSVAILEAASQWSLSAEELIESADHLEAALATAGEPLSAELVQLNTALAALEREQAATLVWQPSLSLGANSNLNFDSYSISLGLSFGLDQIKLDDKAKLAAKIRAKQLEITRKKQDLAYSVQQLQLQGQTLKEALKIQQTALSLAERVYEEAKVQFAAKLIDAGGLEAVRLDKLEASLALTQAAADLLAAWRSLQLYYLNQFTDGGTQA